MKQWHWWLIAGVLEAASGVCMLMGYDAKARRKSEKAWDEALAKETAKTSDGISGNIS